MDFISVFMKSLKDLGSSPVLLTAGFIAGILALPALASYGQFDDLTKSIMADYSQILFPLLILPFFTGGVLGYAVEARQKGSSSLSTFISSSVKNFPKLVMGGAISFVVFYIMFMGIIISWPLLCVVTIALTFFVLLAIEFYDIGIVADGKGVIAAFKNSIDFVRRNLVLTAAFFIVVLALKMLVQVPLSFGMAGFMMSNQTYFSALTNYTSLANYSALSNYTAMSGSNATLNSTSIFGMMPVTFDASSLAAVAVAQVIIQGFVFAFLALYKTEFYMEIKNRKRITDFDYTFEEEQPAR